jgi:hypothetical protein
MSYFLLLEWTTITISCIHNGLQARDIRCLHSLIRKIQRIAIVGTTNLYLLVSNTPLLFSAPILQSLDGCESKPTLPTPQYARQNTDRINKVAEAS